MQKYLKLYYILFISASVLMTSCLSDEGNYDYKDINEIEFSGIEESYSVFRFNNLEITPELNFTLDDDTEGRYTYEWYFYGEGNKVLLSTERNLAIQVLENPGTHDMYYIVKDLVTDIEWQYKFELKIVTSTFEGWLVLSDTNEGPRLDMVSYLSDEEIIPFYDILAASDLTLEGEAESVITYSDGFSTYAVYVSTTNTGTTRVDANTWDWNPGLHLYSEFLSEQPQNVMASNIYSLQSFSPRAYCIVNNNIYYTDPVSRIKYNTPKNRTINGTQFEASKFMAPAGSSPVIYDNTNKKFQYLSGRAPDVYSYDIPDPNPVLKKFDWDNGDDLLFMETNDFNNGNNFAVVRTPDNEYKVYHFLYYFIQYGAYDVSNAPEIDQATHFAINPSFGYLFYAVGGKVYQYNIFDNVNNLVIDKGTEEITCLKFIDFQFDRFGPQAARYKAYQNMLTVGTYDGTNGALEFYEVPEANKPINLNARYEGFGEIKDVDYRERS